MLENNSRLKSQIGGYLRNLIADSTGKDAAVRVRLDLEKYPYIYVGVDVIGDLSAEDRGLIKMKIDNLKIPGLSDYEKVFFNLKHITPEEALRRANRSRFVRRIAEITADSRLIDLTEDVR